MAKYLQVSPHIWTPAFRSLRQDHPEAHGLYLYLLTCRHRNSEGLFWLPVQYMAIDLGMSEQEVSEALGVLHDRSYVVYDDGTEVVLDRHALDYYKPKGPSQIKGAINKLEGVPNTPLKQELMRVAFVSAPEFADEMATAFPSLVTFDTPETWGREGVGTVSTLASKSLSHEGETESETESRVTPEVRSELKKVNEEW